MASTVRSITANWLGGFKSFETRKRYKKDVVLWQRWCRDVGIHPLDCSTVNCQAFVDWMGTQYAVSSVRSRSNGVSLWFSALVKGGVIPANGMKGVKLPALVKSATVSDCVLSEDDVTAIMGHAASFGPRWEWLVAMTAYGGCESAEALRVRGGDVRTWEGRTLVRVRSRGNVVREIPVDGRLEVLTLGLQAVFAANSALGGVFQARYATARIAVIASGALGRHVKQQDLRRFAIRRQFDRGVPVGVIAKWLGHKTDRWVRQMLGVGDPFDDVSAEDVIDLIFVEPDGGRFGSGIAPDSPALAAP